MFITGMCTEEGKSVPRVCDVYEKERVSDFIDDRELLISYDKC